MHYSIFSNGGIMRFEYDEAIYLGLVKRVSKRVLGSLFPGGQQVEFEKILAEMTDKMKEMPRFENLNPVDDSVDIFMLDDIENQDYAYVVFRKGFNMK
jgi:hypothetical protein